MDFEQLRDLLIAEHKTFDADTLRQLSYTDLVRAGIGDAREAGCPLDMIRAERSRRVMELADQIARDREEPSGPKLIEDKDLYDAALRCLHVRPVPPPEWLTLSAPTRAFLLLRCLRAHMDSPEARLIMLHDTLKEIEEHENYRVRAYALLMGKIIDAERHSLVVGDIDILKFRKDTFDFLKFIRIFIPQGEQAIRNHLEVSGYHCTHGCFLPGVDA